MGEPVRDQDEPTPIGKAPAEKSVTVHKEDKQSHSKHRILPYNNASASVSSDSIGGIEMLYCYYYYYVWRDNNNM